MTVQAESVNIDALMQVLFEQMGDAETDEAMESALIAQSENIRIISRACEDTGLFAQSAGKFAEFKAELELSTVPDKRLIKAWHWLLNRIVKAPTRLHMAGSVRLCMPLVAHYLPSESA